MSNDPDLQIDALIDPVALIEAVDDDRFKQFLDHIPVAVAVSELQPSERVTYANLGFQRLTGREAADIEGKSWRALPGIAALDGDDRLLRDAVREDSEYVGVFTIEREVGAVTVDVWSNTIEDEHGQPVYRLVAMNTATEPGDDRVAQSAALAAKDLLLKELQHRVKNNLQMITALIRMEARQVSAEADGERFSRLAGRVHALAVLYDALSHDKSDDQVDLGAYLGQIASAVMQAHGVEGVRLDMKIDTWPVSINVAMPAGLVVNEVMTHALKHAFADEKGGIIKLDSVIDETGCHITIADDGVGLPEGEIWPQPGKLGAIIVKSLKQNASAKIAVRSRPGKGVGVTISFARPESAKSKAAPALKKLAPAAANHAEPAGQSE